MKRRELLALERTKPLIRQLAELDAPEETCGMLAFDGQNMHVMPCANASSSPTTTFYVDPADQKRHLDVIAACRWAFWGLYHSHPTQGPWPSERDRQLAAAIPQGLVWVIVGLGNLTGQSIAGHAEFWVGDPLTT